MEARGTTEAKDVEWMLEAVKLAWLSNAVTSAYCVGCVIIDPKTQTLLSTGYSRELEGNTHAEECALRKLQHVDPDTQVDMYTTMEPCSERLSGNTPCCTSILQFGKVRSVYIGAAEPANLVKCNGVKILLEAGIQVFAVQSEDLDLIKACLAPNMHILDTSPGPRLRARHLRQLDTREISQLAAEEEFCLKIQSLEEEHDLAALGLGSGGSHAGVCVEEPSPSEQKVLAASATSNIVGFIVYQPRESGSQMLDVTSCMVRERTDAQRYLSKMLEVTAEICRDAVLVVNLQIKDNERDLLVECGFVPSKNPDAGTTLQLDLQEWLRAYKEK